MLSLVWENDFCDSGSSSVKPLSEENDRYNPQGLRHRSSRETAAASPETLRSLRSSRSRHPGPRLPCDTAPRPPDLEVHLQSGEAPMAKRDLYPTDRCSTREFFMLSNHPRTLPAVHSDQAPHCTRSKFLRYIFPECLAGPVPGRQNKRQDPGQRCPSWPQGSGESSLHEFFLTKSIQESPQLQANWHARSSSALPLLA